MKIRRSFAVALVAASLAVSAVGGISASAANAPGEVRDVAPAATLSSFETIIPTGLQHTLVVAPLSDGYGAGPDARS
jgi:hypothetical protein